MSVARSSTSIASKTVGAAQDLLPFMQQSGLYSSGGLAELDSVFHSLYCKGLVFAVFIIREGVPFCLRP